MKVFIVIATIIILNIIVCISSILLTIYLDEIIPVFSSWAIWCIWCIFILGAELAEKIFLSYAI